MSIKTIAKDLDLEPGFEDMLMKLLSIEPGVELNSFQKRIHYFAIPGARNCLKSKESGSRANLANFSKGVDLIERLRPVYGEAMSLKVAIVVPYNGQRKLYRQEFQKQREEKGLSETDFPQVITIDSTQGREFDHIILDYVISQASPKQIGFMRDEKRGCVAHTRARKVLWIIGSDFAEVTRSLKEDDGGGWGEEAKTKVPATEAKGGWDDSNTAEATALATGSTKATASWDDTTLADTSKVEAAPKTEKARGGATATKKTKAGSRPQRTQMAGKKQVRKGKKGEDGQMMLEFSPVYFRDEVCQSVIWHPR